MNVPALTERRAADRARMASELQAMAESLGAAVNRRGPGDPCGKREINIRIEAPGGLCLSVWLCGDTLQPDVHVLPWCTRGAARLRPEFGTVNPHHFGKATHVAYGWAGLRAEVERGLRAAADGSAYQVATPGIAP